MTLKEQINADFMAAFKAKDMDRKNFLGVVKGEIQNEAGRSGKEDDDTVLAILKKMEKSLTQTNTEESLKEQIRTTIKDKECEILIKQVTFNKANIFIDSKVELQWRNIVRKFESFKYDLFKKV